MLKTSLWIGGIKVVFARRNGQSIQIRKLAAGARLGPPRAYLCQPLIRHKAPSLSSCSTPKIKLLRLSFDIEPKRLEIIIRLVHQGIIKNICRHHESF